jgi:hypothetical protein
VNEHGRECGEKETSRYIQMQIEIQTQKYGTHPKESGERREKDFA